MAINTRDKRMSMIGLAKPYLRLFQNPTGTIGAAARAMLEFLYSGIGASPPPVLVADVCDTFYIPAESALTVAGDVTTLSVVAEDDMFDVPGCAS